MSSGQVNEKEYAIDLEDYRPIIRGKKSRIFTGRDKGAQVRDESNIVQYETKYEKITIIIPADIFDINPSFLEELFDPIVKKLGREKFHEKFVFDCRGDLNVENDMDEAITRILRGSVSLS